MDKYKAKLESIKSKRLSKQERFQSLLIFISMAFMGLFILPLFGFEWTWALYTYLTMKLPYEWMSYASAGLSILLGLFVIFLIFYTLGIGLKHLTRLISGIRESK